MLCLETGESALVPLLFFICPVLALLLCFYIFDLPSTGQLTCEYLVSFNAQHAIIIMQIINKMQRTSLQNRRGPQIRAKIKNDISRNLLPYLRTIFWHFS